MSSSGRYKSRLFNYLSQKSTRVNDNFNRATRHVKVAAVWGVQILLYPVYVLVQATRLAGYQLQQAVKQASPQLKASTPSSQEPPPTADLPIQQVLSAIDTLALVQSSDLAISEKLNVAESLLGEMKSITVISSESGELKTNHIDAIASSTPSNIDLLNVAEALISNDTVIQGIACDLSSRNLVLVTTANQILNILTPQQQQKLQQRISWELAQFWQQWRLNEQLNQEFQPQIQAPVENRKLLPPIRLFWQVITWVQTGPIAIAANLFQEANLNNSQAAQEFQISALDASSLLLEKLSFLDDAIADLETYPLLPPSGVKISLTHRTQANQRKLPAKDTEHSNLNATPEIEAAKIQSLIKAAVDYFFNKENLQLAGDSTQSENVLTGEVEQQSKLSDCSQNLQLMSATEEEDPWLTSSDLFSKENLPIKAEKPTEKYLNSSNSFTQLPRQQKANISLPNQADIPNRNVSSQPIKANQNPQQPAKRTNNKKNKQVAFSRLASPQRHVKEETKANPREITPYTSPAKSSSHRKLEDTPDWIDAHFTPVGYVKHPLEQLLEWLDRGMVWLEELIVKLWRWINRSRRSK